MKLEKSFEYLHRAEKVIPVQSQTFSKGPRYFPKGAAPVYLGYGYGSRVRDVDKNWYIDFICGLGPITLGYNYPRVNEAIKEQLANGIIFSLPHPLEVELSELLVDIIPCAEMVRFTKTGSEATSAAIKAARAYTGREKVVCCGYHGWHDWHSCTTDASRGIPRAMSYLISPFEYGDIRSLVSILNTEKIAAVIMEPMTIHPPKDDFLQKVKEVTHQSGAVLIFDEVVTGFRWSLGGAQEYFGVTPDLATFGKGMSNGMPLNAVVGKKEIMKEYEWGSMVFFSSTFGGECLSLAAGLATIQEMREKDTIGYCWKLGQKLIDGLNTIGLETIGYPCRPAIIKPFTPEEKTLFLQEVIKRGILLHSGFLINLCFSHTEDDIDRAIEACGEAMEIVNKTVASGDWSILKGEIIQPAFRRI